MKNFIVAAALVLTMITATVALASNEAPKPVYDSANDPEWVAFRTSLTNTNIQAKDKQEYCAKQWDLLWPWAKKGNYEARAILLSLIVSMMHMDRLLPPGTEKKDDSYEKAIIIIGAHTIPMTKKDSTLLFINPDTGQEYPGANFPYEMAKFYIENMKLPEQQKKPYLDCLKETPSHGCADIAVKDGLVPAFDEYAAKIDALMKKGIKASCIIDGYSERKRTITRDGLDAKPRPK